MPAKFKTECLGIRIGFDVPRWFPPDRLEGREPVYHAYAGSFTRDGNSAVDALYRLKGVCENGSSVCGNWVIIECPPGTRDIQKWIRKTREKLDRFFNRYKEARQ